MSTVAADAVVKRNSHANENSHRATSANNEAGAATRHFDVCGDALPTKVGTFTCGQVVLKFGCEF